MTSTKDKAKAAAKKKPDPINTLKVKTGGQIPRENVVAPVGYTVQTQFNIVRLGLEKTPQIGITEISYDTDITGSTGTGTITVAWDEALYDILQVGDAFQLWWGYSPDGYTQFYQPTITKAGKATLLIPPGLVMNPDVYITDSMVDSIPLILTGFIKNVKPSAAKIEIDFYDKGVLLEKTATGFTKSNEMRSDIAKDICTAAGLLFVCDWTKVKGIDGVTSYPVTGDTKVSAGTGESIASGSDTTATVCSANSTRATGCQSVISAGVTYAATGEHCFQNYCPACGGSGGLTTPSWKGGSNSDQITCGTAAQHTGKGHCGADYCGKSGMELSGKCSLQLTPTTSSGTPTTSPTKASPTTSSSGSSYWDMLVNLMTPTTTDVMIFVHLDTVYVLMIPPQDQATLFVDDTVNVIKDSVTITDPLENQVNTVEVIYGSGAKGQKVTVKDDIMVSKYGKNNKSFTEHGYTAEQAQLYAAKQLGIAQRNSGLSIDLTIVGSPYFYPHAWVTTNLSRYGKAAINKTLFLSKSSVKMTAGKATTMDITLEDYYPDVSQKENAADSTAGVINDASMSAIGAQAAKYTWCYQNNKEAEMVSSGCGDCYAMSDFLYDQLNGAGIPTRILQYYSPVSSSRTHRTVQILVNNQWTDFNYAQYGIAADLTRNK